MFNNKSVQYVTVLYANLYRVLDFPSVDNFSFYFISAEPHVENLLQT